MKYMWNLTNLVFGFFFLVQSLFGSFWFNPFLVSFFWFNPFWFFLVSFFWFNPFLVFLFGCKSGYLALNSFNKMSQYPVLPLFGIHITHKT